MRKACELTWEHYAKGQSLSIDFDSFFQDVLAQFDSQADEFSPQRIQDELIGQMSDLLGIDYDVLSLDLTESESRHRALVSDPTPVSTPPVLPDPATPQRSQVETSPVASAPPEPTPANQTSEKSGQVSVDDPTATSDLLQGHIVSQAPTTERLQSIQRMMAEQLGDALPPDFVASVLQSIPVQAGGLYPISDVWYIDPGLDTPDRLRIHIAQFAREIAADASLADCIEDSTDGIGFVCPVTRDGLSPAGRAVLALLVSLSGKRLAESGLDDAPFDADLPALLHGHGDSGKQLSDTALVKLFRLLRLARRLLELEAGSPDHGS